MTGEMHPSRWGDPSRAGALPDSARGLVELAFGLDERPADEDAALPEPHLPGAALAALTDLLGPDHVRLDDDAGDRTDRHSPDSAVRTRIRWHSSQRTTSSAGFAAITPRSAALSVSRQPSHSLRRSIAAPTPPLLARSFS